VNNDAAYNEGYYRHCMCLQKVFINENCVCNSPS